MEDISNIFEKLHISLAEEILADEGCHPPVQELIDASITTYKETKETIPDSKIERLLPLVKKHLQGDNPVTTASLLEFVAEIAKSESLREKCVTEELIPCLLDLLEKDNPAIILQSLRALGNISCDNDEARAQILRSGGVEKIIKKLRNLQNLDGRTEIDNRLRITVCGSVLNVSLDSEPLQKEMINCGAIPVLLDYIENNLDKTDLCVMAANAVSCLVDLDEGRLSFINSGGCRILANGLKMASAELSDAVGECLMGLTEQDDLKLAFVKENCVNTLQEIILSSTCTSENKDVIKKLKIAVDFIVLLLGDDSCLDLLFSNENNGFVDKILLWNNSAEAYVRNSGPVAIGNIARTETNCIRLVKMEVHKHLISLLCHSQENNNEDATRLQMSILSALKNLSVPASNKPVFIESGVLDCTVKFLSSPETPSPVAFLAMSVTRLLVQGQATAVDTVCSQEPCISYLVSVAQNSGIETVKCESSRLLATLLKNARTSASILAVVKNNGLLPVVSTITSTHSIMQNEALVAMALTINVIENEMADKIDETNLLLNINNILNVDDPDPQASYNSMAVIEVLFLKGLVTKDKLEDTGIMNNLEKLTNYSNQTIISQRASSVINKIKNS